jgi:hypothetical protein
MPLAGPPTGVVIRRGLVCQAFDAIVRRPFRVSLFPPIYSGLNMYERLIVACVLTLATGASASAELIRIDNQGTGGWDPATFGVSGFFAEFNLGLHNPFLMDVPHGAELRSVFMTVTSSSLLSKVADTNTQTTVYRFGPSVLVLDIEAAKSPTGPSAFGRFEAPVVDFAIEVTKEEETEIDCPCVVFEGVLGVGVFDQSIAKALGVARRTKGGIVSLVIEQLDAPYEDYREGVAQPRFEIEAVPEPMTLSLLSVAALVGTVRRRMRLNRALGLTPTTGNT